MESDEGLLFWNTGGGVMASKKTDHGTGVLGECVEPVQMVRGDRGGGSREGATRGAGSLLFYGKKESKRRRGVLGLG